MDKFGRGFCRNGIVGRDLVLRTEGPFVIFGVDVNRRGPDGVQFGEGAKVVGVAVRQEIGCNGEAVLPEHGFDVGGVIAGIDNECLFFSAPDNTAVHFKRADGKDFNIHAGENRQGRRGIKAGTEKMSLAASSFMGSVFDLQGSFLQSLRNFNRIR